MVGELNGDDCVDIDFGIQNHIYTTDNNSVGCLDLIEEYDRLCREQRSLSRKQQGSNNWEQQRQQVVEANRKITRKVEDFQQKLTTWVVNEYDAVFVEDFDLKPMLEFSQNAKNK